MTKPKYAIELTIGLTQSNVDSIIDSLLYWEEDYSKETLQQVGYDRKALRTAIQNDPKFIKLLTQVLDAYADADTLSDISVDAIPPIANLLKKMNKIERKLEQDRDKQRETDRVEAAIKLLVSSGYTVNKK